MTLADTKAVTQARDVARVVGACSMLLAAPAAASDFTSAFALLYAGVVVLVLLCAVLVGLVNVLDKAYVERAPTRFCVIVGVVALSGVIAVAAEYSHLGRNERTYALWALVGLMTVAMIAPLLQYRHRAWHRQDPQSGEGN